MLLCRILGENPTLEASKASGHCVHVTAMGVLPEGVAEESPTARHLSHVCGSYRWPPLEFLAEPVCAFILLAWVCPVAFDLAVVVWLPLSLFDECFVVVVIGLLSGRCFAAEIVMATPLCEYLP